MKLQMISEGSIQEGWKRDAGHFALDVIGLLPGPGELADFANAMWYAREGEYLNSAFSLISMIPEVGDLIGKGAKNIKRMSSGAVKFFDKVEPLIFRFWPTVLEAIEKIDSWKPYVVELDKAINDFLDGIRDVKHAEPEV